jgi:hypothetical protein
METITHTSVKWVYTKEFGNQLIPIIYFDGQITFTANQWIHSLIEQGYGASKLERYIRDKLIAEFFCVNPLYRGMSNRFHRCPYREHT